MATDKLALHDPRAQLRFGWRGLVFFTLVGLALEGLHGFKAGLYLDVGNEVRRLMWTLGHAHGTLLCLLHIAWGATLKALGPGDDARRARATKLLRVATVLLPGGFLLGGVWIHDGDPGLATVLLAPPGGLALIAGLVVAAREV